MDDDDEYVAVRLLVVDLTRELSEEHENFGYDDHPCLIPTDYVHMYNHPPRPESTVVIELHYDKALFSPCQKTGD